MEDLGRENAERARNIASVAALATQGVTEYVNPQNPLTRAADVAYAKRVKEIEGERKKAIGFRPGDPEWEEAAAKMKDATLPAPSADNGRYDAKRVAEGEDVLLEAIANAERSGLNDIVPPSTMRSPEQMELYKIGAASFLRRLADAKKAQPWYHITREEYVASTASMSKFLQDILDKGEGTISVGHRGTYIEKLQRVTPRLQAKPARPVRIGSVLAASSRRKLKRSRKTRRKH